jgi:hypothetical protein
MEGKSRDLAETAKECRQLARRARAFTVETHEIVARSRAAIKASQILLDGISRRGIALNSRGRAELSGPT